MVERPRIVFLILSAVQSAETVAQLAASLAPHRVLVHHDFSQTPSFRLDSPNVAFVPEPKRTGWGTWGFSEAILHSLQVALSNYEFDYLQLLSPTCLPIKPMKAFEAHVTDVRHDAHFGAIDLLADRDALMSVGYRAFARNETLRFRILRRLAQHYFRTDASARAEAGVWVHTGVATNKDGTPALLPRLALSAVRMSSHPLLGRHVFDSELPPYFGSVWFGAKRNVLKKLIARASDNRLRDCFRRIQLPEEFLFASLLMQSSESPGPLNHFVNSFDQANPRWLTDDDVATLERTPAFFARKFVDDAMAPLRLRFLRSLADLSVADGSPISGVAASSPRMETSTAEPSARKLHA